MSDSVSLSVLNGDGAPLTALQAGLTVARPRPVDSRDSARPRPSSRSS